jgi:hypothetical protein
VVNQIHLKKQNMKTNLLKAFSAAMLLAVPAINFAQAPNLGSTVNFALFTSNGAITNSGITHITGHVGSNTGSSTGFGNVNGVMHDQDLASGQAATDLLIAYNELNSATPTFFLAPLLGNGDTLTPGVYSIAGATVLSLNLFLNAQGNPNAVFILQIQGTLSASANAKVKLLNNAKACNVFWKVEGLVSIAPGTSMKGTIVANNSAINITTNDTLEGRALSTTGAISVDGVLVYTPVGCGSPTLTGPVAPNLGTTECYALFSVDGDVTNSGTTFATGDIGTNVGLTTGYNALNVTGTIHPIPDVSTATAAADLNNVNTYVNSLQTDIELLYPAQFGNNLVLTPHTYLLNSATVFTDTLYLNAQGNANAVFVIKINGALSTSTFAKVVLINSAQANNVYWKTDGAIAINDYAVLAGTFIGNNGAISINAGVTINGRVLSNTGTLTTASVTATVQTICTPTGVNEISHSNEVVNVYPNPFSTSLTLALTDKFTTAELQIFNMLGEIVLRTDITEPTTTLATTGLTSGIYFYKVITNNKVIQSGKITSQQ